MNFFTSLINKIRGINQTTKTQTIAKSYMFGVILSGTYSNWKRDPHPTILCFGCYTKQNGIGYVHGIQLHAIGGLNQWLINTIQNMKNNGIITNPYSFYNYIKTNQPSIIKLGYRTYRVDMTDFRIVNAGLTNIQGNYHSDDNRDVFLENLNPIQTPKKIIDINALKQNITRVINTVKIW